MAARMSELLSIWTIYDHPSDYPSLFVARRFVVDASGPQATTEHIGWHDLDELRAMMMGAGLTVLTRSPGDDPKIIESWL
jgi:hypothetical protein